MAYITFNCMLTEYHSQPEKVRSKTWVWDNGW